MLRADFWLLSSISKKINNALVIASIVQNMEALVSTIRVLSTKRLCSVFEGVPSERRMPLCIGCFFSINEGKYLIMFFWLDVGHQ